MEFSSPAWSPWLEKDIECLENAQRRAVKMVTGLRGTSYEEKLTESSLTTLSERRHQTDMLQTYKILTGKDKVKSESLFVKASENERATRSSAYSLNLRVPASRLEIRRNFYSQRVPEQWNQELPALKQSKTAAAFKNAYAAHRRDMAATLRIGDGA